MRFGKSWSVLSNILGPFRLGNTGFQSLNSRSFASVAIGAPQLWISISPELAERCAF